MDLETELGRIVGPRGLLREGLEERSRDIRGYVQGKADLAVLPASTEEAAAVVRLLAARGIGFVPQGGNTGLCGGAVPNARAPVLIGLDRMDAIGPVDAGNLTVTVGAGAILARVRAAAAEAGCLFPLSIGSEGSCRIGGTIATNAGGHNVLRYGSMRGLVLGLEVVLPDGRILSDLRGLRKDNTGYDLKQAFIGAEGTTGLITRATLALVPAETRVETALVAVPSVEASVALLARLRREAAGLVTACEYLSAGALAAALARVPGASWPLGTAPGHALLVELALPPALPAGFSVLEALLEQGLEAELVLDATLAASEAQRRAMWRLREAVVEGLRIEGGLIAHDISLPISRLAAFVAECSAGLERAFPGCRPAPFGHLGDGNLHFNVQFPAGGDPTAFLVQREAVNRLVHELVRDFGGSFSAEHGIGLLKRDELARYEPPVALELMRRLRAAFDPEGLSNPGKVLPD